VYERKLYPGYVFVEMATEPDGSISENVWFLIKETTGVGDFIGSGGKPSPMLPHDVEKMLASALSKDESPTLANVNFAKGDKVKVNEGPFENLEGVVDEINSQKGTVRVIATVFGRPTPIELEYWQLEKI
jgi:transcriptional antiterminator NusG